jgi:hypothetical protein
VEQAHELVAISNTMFVNVIWIYFVFLFYLIKNAEISIEHYKLESKIQQNCSLTFKNYFVFWSGQRSNLCYPIRMFVILLFKQSCVRCQSGMWVFLFYNLRREEYFNGEKFNYCFIFSALPTVCNSTSSSSYCGYLHSCNMIDGVCRRKSNNYYSNRHRSRLPIF